MFGILVVVAGFLGGEVVRVASEAGELLAVAEGRDAAADYLAEAANAVFSVNTSPLAWTLSSQGLHHIGDRRDFTWALLMHSDLIRRLAEDLDRRKLSELTSEIGLDQVIGMGANILAGSVRGRIVVKIP